MQLYLSDKQNMNEFRNMNNFFGILRARTKKWYRI